MHLKWIVYTRRVMVQIMELNIDINWTPMGIDSYDFIFVDFDSGNDFVWVFSSL